MLDVATPSTVTHGVGVDIFVLDLRFYLLRHSIGSVIRKQGIVRYLSISRSRSFSAYARISPPQ